MFFVAIKARCVHDVALPVQTPYDQFFNNSPALKLLRSEHAAFMLDFFREFFKEQGAGLVPEEDLETALSERLAKLRAEGSDAPAQNAHSYLEQWCGDGCGYLRRFYSEEHACHVYQLTRHTEKVLAWLDELARGEKRGYATSQSRFGRIVDEMRKLGRDTDENPEVRIADLLKRRDEIDREIQTIREAGLAPVLTDAQIRDVLNDLETMVAGFLSDFREIEDNFKDQARAIHELYVEKQLKKGDVVEKALDAEEELRSRDQGRSYFGFRELVRSVESREELQRLSERASALARERGVETTAFENLPARLYREVATVQESYRKISSQLRRIVEERSAGEARYLGELLKDVKRLALLCRENPPEDSVMLEWEEPLRINNLMEVSFWEPAAKGDFGSIGTQTEADDDSWKDALKKVGRPLDLPHFRALVDSELKDKSQISLRELVEKYPGRDGVVDFVAYTVVACERENSLIDAASREKFDLNRPVQPRYVEMDKIIFLRQ
jgi:hypothetical protein